MVEREVLGKVAPSDEFLNHPWSHIAHPHMGQIQNPNSASRVLKTELTQQRRPTEGSLGLATWIKVEGLAKNMVTFSTGIKVKSESEVAQSCQTLCDPMDWGLPGFFVHGIFQARILDWVAISFSRRSSWPREWTRVSCIVGRCFTIWATRKSTGIKQDPKPHNMCYRQTSWFLSVFQLW